MVNSIHTKTLPANLSNTLFNREVFANPFGAICGNNSIAKPCYIAEEASNFKHRFPGNAEKSLKLAWRACFND